MNQDRINIYIKMDDLSMTCAKKYGTDSQEFIAITEIKCCFVMSMMTPDEFKAGLQQSLNKHGFHIKID